MPQPLDEAIQWSPNTNAFDDGSIWDTVAQSMVNGMADYDILVHGDNHSLPIKGGQMVHKP
ncbi:MAG: hypothetical protein OSA43_09845 [Pirellulales bacterium]|nr:hypothetical protein [Pirellulales bacterium]